MARLWVVNRHLHIIGPESLLWAFFLSGFLYFRSMMRAKSLLHSLASYYGGQLTEHWENEQKLEGTAYTVQIDGPGFAFEIESDRMPREPVEHLVERTCEQLVWFILQKGVESVKEQGEIYKMFNPESGNE
jgi:hypothetical protein